MVTRPRAAPDDTDHLILDALADPVRHQIVRYLSCGPMSVTALARLFDVVRPAVSRHLKVLMLAGLVRRRKFGSQNIYSLETAPLRRLQAHLASLAQAPTPDPAPGFDRLRQAA